jgi:hypothetical protein
MPQVNVSQPVHSQLTLLARAWKISEGDAVRRLLEEFQRDDEPSAHAPSTGVVEIHADYQGTRTHGEFDATTHRVTITSGPLSGKSWKSPSGAAVALVRQANPTIRAERNGWAFWVVSSNGEAIQTLR